MKWEVRIFYKPGVQDTEGEFALEGLKALGFKKLKNVNTAKIYFIEGNYSRKDVEDMCRRLLANPVSQGYEIIAKKQAGKQYARS